MAVLGSKISEDTRRKMSLAKMGKKRKPFTIQTRIKMSENHKGQKNSLWKNGISKMYKYSTLVHKLRKEKLAGRKRPESCEICYAVAKRICFDHDHKTGKFRGWICTNCNIILGHSKDNSELLKKIIAYISK